MTPTSPTDRQSRTVVVGAREYEGDRLACPNCGATYGVHIDHVQVFANAENGGPIEVGVSVYTGVVVPRPASGPAERELRPQPDVALTGTCEHCPGKRLALGFRQHEGVTFVEWQNT